MTLDLNKSKDFTAVTSTIGAFSQVTGGLASGASSLAMLFGRRPEDWDIQEGSYNGVIFHVLYSKLEWSGALSSIQDTGGRRLAKYLFPYKDGGTTDDLGRMPETFDLEIILHGDNYVKCFTKLFTEFNKPKPGNLFHPVRGGVTCKMSHYSIKHEHATRKAMLLSVQFVEHNFSIASYGRMNLTPNYKSLLSKIAKGLGTINDLISKVKAFVSFITSISNILEGLINSFRDLLTIAASNVNSVYGGGVNNSDIPSITPINFGGLLSINFGTAPTGITSGTATAEVTQIQTNIATVSGVPISLITRVNDPYAKIPLNALSQQTALAVAGQTIQKQINDARSAGIELINALQNVKNNSPFLNTTSSTASTQTVEGSIIFHADIQNIKQMLVDLQIAYELAISANKTKIIDYTTPRLMSIREIAFVNGLSPDNFLDISVLNPEILSLNHIAKNSIIKVPIS